MQLEKINRKIDAKLENLDELFDDQIRSLCEAKAGIEVLLFLKYLKEKEKNNDE